jgi:hypothetical protein
MKSVGLGAWEGRPDECILEAQEHETKIDPGTLCKSPLAASCESL